MQITFNLNIYAIIISILFVIIISVIVITYYLNRNRVQEIYTKSNNKGQEKNEKKSIVTKKDMCYWILFLITLGILWGSSHIYDKVDFTQYVSFSGTVTSIVLGVVAIIYSFFQSFDNSNSKESLQVVSNNLRKSSDEIKSHTDKVLILDTKLEELTKSIDRVVDDVKNISENMRESIDSLGSRLEKVENKVDEANSNIQKLDNKKFSSDDWKIKDDNGEVRKNRIYFKSEKI